MAIPNAPGTSVDFARAARVLSREARARRLVVPGFRCPPRVVGVHRTLRRQPNGAVVAVQIRGRPWFVVVGDMIEGVIVANRLQPPAADRLRAELWEAMCAELPDELPRPRSDVA
jgi:hypothetical protein